MSFGRYLSPSYRNRTLGSEVAMIVVRIQRHRRGRIGNVHYSRAVIGPGVPFWQRSAWYLWPPGYVERQEPSPSASIRTLEIPFGSKVALFIERRRG